MRDGLLQSGLAGGYLWKEVFSAMRPEGLEEASREDPGDKGGGRTTASAKAPRQPQWRVSMQQRSRSAEEEVKSFYSSRQVT